MIVDQFEQDGKLKQGYVADLVRMIICDGNGDNGCGIETMIINNEKFVAAGIGILKEPIGVGNAPIGENAKGKVDVVFAFNNIQSIDVTIGWFQQVKERLINEQQQEEPT